MGIKESLGFLTNKSFLKQLLYLLIFILVVIFGALQWLKYYTHHGQKLEMPNYIGMNIDIASDDAKKKSFEMIVDDSVHRVGISGGEITEQNPKANSIVKQNRKVYVTRTKYNADKIAISSLPSLYGKRYSIKSNELRYINLKSSIKGYQFDSGEKGFILEVWYNGKKIIDKDGMESDVKVDKGGELEFILSKQQGGSVNIPNLRCKTYAEAKFTLELSRLKIGMVNNVSDELDEALLFVIRQFPQVDQSAIMNGQVNITLSDELPDDCK